jgi:ABC-type Fe3+/spermidine/putrescine transport system ATPase subunit
VLCVRREHVRVEKFTAGPRWSGSDRREQFFSGVVRAISFQGLHQEYVLDLGGVMLRAVGPPFEVQEGDTVAITIDRDNCVILPSRASASRQERTGIAR